MLKNTNFYKVLVYKISVVSSCFNQQVVMLIYIPSVKTNTVFIFSRRVQKVQKRFNLPPKKNLLKRREMVDKSRK